MPGDPLLLSLWSVSLLLAGFSTSVMSTLILWRLISGKRRDVRRARVDATVLALLEDADTVPKTVKRIVGDADLLAALIVELAGLIRGRDFAHVIEQLKALGAGARLAGSVRRGSAESRIIKIEALSHLDSRRHRQLLRQILSSKDPVRVRLVALSALLGFGEMPDDDVINRLFRHREFASSFDAKSILGEIAALDPAYLARRVADTNDTETVRAMMLSALGDCGYLPAADLAVALTDHTDTGLRRAAFEVLGQLGMPVSVAILRRGLSDPDPAVRSEAAEAAGRIIVPELAEDLGRCLADPAWDVRFTAARALMSLGPVGQKVLHYLAGVESAHIDRITAASVLKEGLAA